MKLFTSKKSVLIIFSILFTIPLVIYFYNFHGNFSSKQDDWGGFGSYISGFYGTLAFLVLVYTTRLTTKQFKIQNEDNVFFRLFDSLQARISNAQIISENQTYTAHQSLRFLAESFEKELSFESIGIAKNLLKSVPEKISDTQFLKIYEALKKDWNIESYEEFRAKFLADMNKVTSSDKGEILKVYIGGFNQQSPKLIDALRSTGSVNFYRIPFSVRRHYYGIVAERLISKHGEFLDGYLKNICFLLEIASNSENENHYINFLKSQLTKYEIIILFYLIAGAEFNFKKKEFFINMKYLKKY
ncbi:hypothetical protein [Methyloradius palustris]|uniref:Phage abortive infection protein n=1 Tax=Methyloradius palustris TaxID=2778876 RepID=A0A8D5JM22_9PROT|nr:hypothetical protein [Methyloradius palustris]BCM25420.1 hypothetical protein ZMTM_16790 [Methyloradius palustris]